MKYEQILELVDTIEEAVIYVQGLAEGEVFAQQSMLLEDIAEGLKIVNIELFDSESTRLFHLRELQEDALERQDGSLYTKKLLNWCVLVREIIAERMGMPNELDERFVWIMDHVNYVEEEILVQLIKNRLMKLDEHHIRLINQFYQNHSYFWGTLDIEKERYDVIYDRVNVLKKHREDFVWLYNKLGDYRSKLVLVNTLYNWISFEPNYIRQMHEQNYKDYYDLDLLQCDENEVMVDIGAYTGDSALDYINTYRKYRKIYCYEITPETVDIMRVNLQDYEHIEIINKGVGAAADKMYLQKCAQDTSTNGLRQQEGEIEIEVTTLDEDIKEPVTLIKMDIEGAEQSALQGCVRHIKEERPKLLICVYHNNRDIFEIPRMIDNMRGDYKFYLRSNGMQWAPAEIVLFAL